MLAIDATPGVASASGSGRGPWWCLVAISCGSLLATCSFVIYPELLPDALLVQFPNARIARPSFFTGVESMWDGVIPDPLPVGTFNETLLDGCRRFTLPDGTEYFAWPRGQKEKRSPNGIRDIVFPSRTHQKIHPDGKSTIKYASGTVQLNFEDGSSETRFASGAVVRKPAPALKLVDAENASSVKLLGEQEDTTVDSSKGKGKGKWKAKVKTYRWKGKGKSFDKFD